jgi:exopolysaccharide biosynthesis polyprenyl glycosylphosphotransferase
MLRQRLNLYRFLLYSCDLCLVALCWATAYWFRFILFKTAVVAPPPFQIYLNLTIIPLAVFAILLPVLKIYLQPLTNCLYHWKYILRACILGILVCTSITYFFQPFAFSRAVFLLFFIFLTFSLTFYRPFFCYLWNRLSARPAGDRTAIIGGGPMANALINHIQSHQELGINIVGHMDDQERQTEGIRKISCLGNYDNLRSTIQHNHITSIIIIFNIEETEKLLRIIKSLGNEMVDIKILPDFTGLTPLRGQMVMLDDIPLISLYGNTLEGWPRICKRVIDIFGAVTALLLFSIPMIMLALWIKRISPGPVFYRQQRMGLDGRLFNMYKFRTMVVDAEEKTGPIWAANDDPRCIPMGNWIRLHNLDELPQLYNVLKGEMSLVGPRPERPELIRTFKETIPGYMLRHRVKAGVTGWAQINGWRGCTSLAKRIEYDLYYIQNWSIALDMEIILQTLRQTILPPKTLREQK